MTAGRGSRCGEPPGVDEDIAFCWECIDILLPPRKESSSEDLLFLLSGRKAAVHEHAEGAEEVWTGGGVYDYWHAMAIRWGQDDLVTIEQDNGIHESVIPQFEACPEPWCSFGYQIGGYICTEGNGCRKLSLEAQEAVTFEHLEYPRRCRGGRLRTSSHPFPGDHRHRGMP